MQKEFSQRQHFFMIGNFLHEPNWDAVLWCKQNFIGSMLKYHLHRSHEFMSRWIEEKNK